MTTATHQAAQLLHHIFAPQGSWETLAEAIEEVAEMLAPERIALAAMLNDEVVGWIGGVPRYHGNVWELHPFAICLCWAGVGDLCADLA